MTFSSHDIQKLDIPAPGSGFLGTDDPPDPADVYRIRQHQNKGSGSYRSLLPFEIDILQANGNISDNWEQVFVSDPFLPELIRHCRFFGWIRIGRLQKICLAHKDLVLPVGLYQSTLVSCDIGDNVVIDRVGYLSHYIIGNDVMMVNVGEMLTTGNAKFGNGILREGEEEAKRVWLEIGNENGGRRVAPFDGMLAGDAFLWNKFRGNAQLMTKLLAFTDRMFSWERGSYGEVGRGTVIKNCKSVKDTLIGERAYLKGANKLKNLTIHSGEEGRSQIGEGCELVNGIIGYGCRVFYGVKAVRFVMANHSQLKYGARLINSYLGENSTISCCEVLNSLLFPAHEQHHNNSFLCAATVLGQSNIPAGATIGSNHNSRAADGELLAERGFWPGLCVSLKHNSKFAPFTLLVKGDYPSELKIPVPFSLVSHDIARDRLLIVPGYWFLSNLYALERNCKKWRERDKRKAVIQYIEYDYLAPDCMEAVVQSLPLFEQAAGKAYYKYMSPPATYTEEEYTPKGKEWLENRNEFLKQLDITVDGWEHSNREVVLVKVIESYHIFKNLVKLYCVTQLLQFIQKNRIESWDALQHHLPRLSPVRSWWNIGGQLIPKEDITGLIENICQGEIQSWEEIHRFYQIQSESYFLKKLSHSLSLLHEVWGSDVAEMSPAELSDLFRSALQMKDSFANKVADTRKKDYDNPFRNMMYEDEGEREAVVGRLDENAFIKDVFADYARFKQQVERCLTW